MELLLGNSWSNEGTHSLDQSGPVIDLNCRVVNGTGQSNDDVDSSGVSAREMARTDGGIGRSLKVAREWKSCPGGEIRRYAHSVNFTVFSED